MSHRGPPVGGGVDGARETQTRYRAALRDPRQRTRQISQIAYAWGFNDLSYFNRAFRRRFEVTPRDWRDGGAYGMPVLQ